MFVANDQTAPNATKRRNDFAFHTTRAWLVIEPAEGDGGRKCLVGLVHCHLRENSLRSTEPNITAWKACIE